MPSRDVKNLGVPVSTPYDWTPVSAGSLVLRAVFGVYPYLRRYPEGDRMDKFAMKGVLFLRG